MADFRIGDHPDNDQLGAFCTELGAETFQRLLIMYFFGKWGIDQNNIVVFQCFYTDIYNGFILIIPDIFFKEVGTAVDFFSCSYKDTV